MISKYQLLQALKHEQQKKKSPQCSNIYDYKLLELCRKSALCCVFVDSRSL